MTLFNIARPLTDGQDGEGMFASDQNIEDVVKQNLKNLLLTQKGERVHKRNFGSNLRHLLFEQKTDALKTMITEDILKSVSLWTNYIIIDAINVIYYGEKVSDKFKYLQINDEKEVVVIIEYHYNILSKTIKDMLELTVETA